MTTNPKPGSKRAPILLSLFSTLTLSALSAISPATQAADSTVCALGCDYSFIQTAIDASATVDGDTITVSDGTYAEAINFNGKNITVTSVNGAASTFLVGDDNNNPMVRFANGETSAAVLQGFTIDNQVTVSTFVAIQITDSSAYINGVSINGPANSSWNHQGIVVTGSNGTTVENSTITGSNLGIQIGMASSVSLNSVAVDGNQIALVVDGASHLSMAGGSLSNNVDSNGNVYIDSGSAVSLLRTVLNNNAGTVINSSGSLTLDDVVLTGNSGSGLFIGAGTAVVTNSLFSGNVSHSTPGGAIYNGPGSSLFLYNSTIVGNYAFYAGGGIYTENGGSSSYVKNSIVWGNDSDDGSQVYGLLTAIYSNIEGGYTGSGLTFDGDLDGTGNFAGLPADDPLFVSLVQAGPGAPTTAGDYHLLASSPMVDAGKSTGLEVPTHDIDGDLRDAVVDIGADEVVIAAPSFSISGIAYAADRITPVADGSTVRLLVNGVSQGTASTMGGNYSIDVAGGINAGDAMLVYLDDSASKGNTATVSNGANMVDLNIYADHLTVRHDNYASATNTTLVGAYQPYSDTDILYNVSPKGALFSLATMLYIPTSHDYLASMMYIKGIEVDGRLTLGEGYSYVSGGWDSSEGSVSYTGYPSVTFTAASGVIPIDPSNAIFRHVTFSGDAEYDLRGPFVVDAGLNMQLGTQGTFRTNSHPVTAGNYYQPVGYVDAGTSNITVSGSVLFDGAADSTGYNNATLTMWGTGSLSYNSLAGGAHGIGHLIAGQGGVTTLQSYMTVWDLTLGSGELTGLGELVVRGAGSPFTFDAASSFSVAKLKLWNHQSLPSLLNGYETDVYVIKYNADIGQSGDVNILGNLYVGTIEPGQWATFNTNGYDLTVSGSIVVGQGSDTGLKTLNGVGSSINAGVSIDVATGPTPAEFLYTPGMVFVNGVPYTD